MSLFRILAFTLCVVLLYALYLPSAYPPESFVEQLRTEHGLNAAFWGEEHAHQLLQSSLALYAHQSEVVPAAFASSPGAAVNDTNAVVAHQMSEVLERVFHNRYTQAFDALLLLAAYRLYALLQWWQWITAFILIACFDGYLVRVIRSKEFLEHSPMRFALCAIGATLALALALLLLVMPVSVHPLLLGVVSLALGTLVAMAISHFHR
jgi:hypothetical protein